MQQVNTAWHELITQGGPTSWIVAIIAAFVLTVLVRLVLRTGVNKLSKIAARTDSIIDDVIVSAISDTKSFVIFFWFLISFVTIFETKASTLSLCRLVFVLVTAVQVAIWGMSSLKFWHRHVLLKKMEQDLSTAAALGLLYTSIQVGFIVIVFLIGLSNLGVNIGALLAGLGVGGIAVALAAQNILGDLLSSLSIVLDKPFVVGDYIVVGNDQGTVEHIGIKTTRVRSLWGEQLVFSNKDLLESRVRNFKRMTTRRVVQKIGVTYETDSKKLEEIPKWVQQSVEKNKLRFERCHLSGYGASSLDYELVFWVPDPDYQLYMDLQQKMFLEIIEKFKTEKVEFAYPTQTLFVEKVNLQTSEERNPSTI